MFKNFIIIALRSLVKYKAYSLINISGLAIGLASAILILLYVKDEKMNCMLNVLLFQINELTIKVNDIKGKL